MAIEFECPTCGGTLQVGDGAVGRVIRCGGCMTALRVPDGPPDPYAVDRPVPPTLRPSTPAPAEPRRRSGPDDPPDDRPRRPAPPPSGPGVFIWLVIFGGVMLVGMGCCCGGLLLMAPGAKWQKHESGRGGFRIEAPGKMERDAGRAAGIQLEKGTESEGALVIRRNERYFVFYRTVPGTKERAAKGAETDDQLVAKELEAVRAAAQGGPIGAGDPVKVDGFDGREVEFHGDDGWYTARVVAADTRVYVLLVNTGADEPGGPAARRFIDSFEITDKTIAAEGKRRADQAKPAGAAAGEVKERAAKAQGETEEEKRKEGDRAAREQARRQKAEGENAAFTAAQYRGRPVPDAESVVAGAAVEVFPFDLRGAGGVRALESGWPVVRPAVLGPGVRGKAAYLKPDSVSTGPNDAGDAVRLNRTLRAAGGYTLSGWARVRYAPVSLFRVHDAEDASARPVAELVVGRTHVAAEIAGAAGPVELKHAWTRDDGWHHIALVRSADPDEPTVTLYLDGTPVEVASVRPLPLPKSLGVVTGAVGKDADWPGPPDAGGKPAAPTNEYLVGAIDECVLVGRPLTGDEVGALAGRLPRAPAPRPVRK